MIPPSLSPSQLTVWNTCEYKWHLQYVESLAPVGPEKIWFAKGSYLHELLHYYYGMLASGITIGDPIILDVLTERIKRDLTDADVDNAKFFEECVRTIYSYVKDRSPLIDTGMTEIDVERELVLMHDGRGFHGFMDLLYYDKDVNRWVIRDHKTGNRDTYSVMTVRTSSQLKFYATLAYKILGIVPMVEISWINSSPPKKPGRTKLWNLVRVDFKIEQLEYFWNYLQGKHNDQKNLTPSKNLGECSHCPYLPICESQEMDIPYEQLKERLYRRVQRKSLQPQPTEEVSTPTESISVKW